MRRELLIAFVVSFAAASAGFAQERPDKCAQVKYSQRLTNPYHYRLKSIEGQTVFGDVSEKGELVSAAAVCIALFNARDQRLVATVTTEMGGQFKFASLPAGRYVLILSLDQLHPNVIPVALAGRSRSKAFKHWGLLLHLRSREDPRKSFVTTITQLRLRAELLDLLRNDQAIRNEMIRHGANVTDPVLVAREAVIDAASTARMKEIVKRYGWPGQALVSRDGEAAAFLLVQHSPDFTFQQAMLPLVHRSYEAGKISAWDYSLLVDRVLVRGGKRQRYGNSVNHWDGKEPVLDPIEDEVNVDQRRAKIGLPPLREYLEGMKRLYFPQD
jgi:hypothetical protein